MWGVTMWMALAATAVLLWNPLLHRTSTTLSFALHAVMALPFFALAGLFIVNDTSILHVAAYGGESLPLKYRFAATWAAREGPLLMWLGWMALLAWWWRRPLAGEDDEDGGVAHVWRLRTAHVMSLTLLLIAFSLDPFKPTPAFFRGAGLNPLLQTDLMVIHPPLIFLAYSFCLHLTAVAISVMLTRSDRALGTRMLHIARPGLLMATLGIGLGGLWAYLILDWGGYWAWDPVETGSFLPWLALVMLVHLRTRPGKVTSDVWVGAGLATGFLSLFATTVTRAGGVWASSVHTFVTSESGTPPDDVFGRLMVLRSDGAATEVMTYVVWMVLLLGLWLAVQRSKDRLEGVNASMWWVITVPAWMAGLGSLLFVGGDGLGWDDVPPVAYLGVALTPLLLARPATSKREDGAPWSYRTWLPVPLDVVFPVAVYAVTQDVFISLATAVLFVPLYHAESALKAWPWAAAGVTLGLGFAWSQLLTIPVAGGMLLAFVLPWLVAPQEETAKGLNLSRRRDQQRMALWGSVLLVSLYLVLTWVLLLASIDAVNFEAHELYGAPFIAALAAAMFLYSRRADDARQNAVLLAASALVSVAGFAFAPNAFGQDASTSVSEHLTRGHLVWMTLPTLLLATLPMAREVKHQLDVARKKSVWKRVPLGAHLVHLGLLVLLLGHLSTTVLVDRGDASHRLSLVKDEVIVHRGFGFEFNELVLESEGLEVGDGFIGVRISVYQMDGATVGDLIGTVMPGTLRFDSQGIPRSEVDTLTGLTGDLVFIFDGSQAGSLMATAQTDGLDEVQLIRVTVYDLPHSHTVWLGWGTMMFGMALVTVAGASPKQSDPEDEETAFEEE